MIKRVSITLAIMLVAVSAHRVMAQGFNAAGEFCAPASDLLAAAKKMGEEQVFSGRTADGYRFVVTKAKEGKGWTLIMIDNKPGPGGLVPGACVKANDQDAIAGEPS